jgi:hypothetical protein
MDATNTIVLLSATAPFCCSAHRTDLLSVSAIILGLCPCSMWAHMTLFYASGPDLAVAWSYIAAAQPLAQVSPAPACVTGCPDAWGHLLET